MPIPAVRGRPATLGSESCPAKQPCEAGGWAASRPTVRLDQGQDPLLVCCPTKAHLRPPPNSTSCLQLNVSSGERWLEAAAGQLQVEPGGVRAYRGDPVELRGWRGSESESVLKEREFLLLSDRMLRVAAGEQCSVRGNSGFANLAL